MNLTPAQWGDTPAQWGDTPIQWDDYITRHQGHLLQSWNWGELKSQFGWRAMRLQTDGTAAQLLFRRLPLGFTIAYLPKGPVVDWSDSQQCQAIFTAIHTAAKKQRAIFLKVEPPLRNPDNAHNVPDEQGRAAASFLSQSGFKPADTIQPQTSLIIDISREESDILAGMKQKTRYNTRLGPKKGVTVRRGQAEDVAIFHKLAESTSTRNEFGVHSLAYYQAAYRLFAPDACALLIAEYQSEALAALMLFSHGPNAYYFYGASSNQHRNLMAPYLAQWEAIRWAKSQGCLRYDLWGIPNADPPSLEADFKHRNDGLWGVYRFKRGFGAQYEQSIGAFDYVYNRPLYQLYRLRRG